MRNLFLGLMTVGSLSCSQRTHTSPIQREHTSSVRAPGYVLAPAAGEPLIFCDTPDLTVNIKVSPLTTGDSPVVMGTAELAKGSNFGTHREQDEIIYFLAGRGQLVVGEKTFPIALGTTAYIPRGVRHGFVNEGDSPIRFVWVNVPPGLEERFRAGGHPPSYDCSQEATNQ
jgi:mannose-6-phosphate isomerase-like protein (cupin superfamily)